MFSSPIYRRICEKTGFSGAGVKQKDYRQVIDQSKTFRKFKIRFIGFCEPELPWSFYPLQEEIDVSVGETVLSFFRCRNNSDKPLIGIATYVVHPDPAVPYFNKVQCFCFDEQMLNANEEIDMPVFFYLDPLISDDRALLNENTLTVQYTFFLADD